ncbi:MAG: lipoprotein-releasing ABC transporter permease subunit [Pyrinomonadaceae bacterium]
MKFLLPKFFDLFLAVRHLRFARRRAVQTFTALAGVVGIACGVAVLIFAQALAHGFRDELQTKILRGTAHLTIQRVDGAAFDEREVRDLKARVRGVAGVTEVSATSYTGALLSGRDASSYAIVRGVERDAPRRMSEIKETVVAGSFELLSQSYVPQSKDDLKDSISSAAKDSAASSTASDDVSRAVVTAVLIGDELARRVGLKVGDEAELITSDAASTVDLFASKPRVLRVRVAGIFRTGLSDYDATWIYAPVEIIGRPAIVSVETTDIYDTSNAVVRVRRLLGEKFTVIDWRETNQALFAALTLERRVVSLIIALVMFVAALNITTTLMLGVVERRAEIAVLRVLGARGRNILQIFLLEGLLIGSIGAGAGVVFGVGACIVANRFELIKLPADVYSLSFVPLHLRAWDVLLAAGLALALALLATVYPVRAALRVKPSEILRG